MTSPVQSRFGRRSLLSGLAGATVAAGVGGLAGCGSPGAVKASTSTQNLSMVGISEPQAGRGIAKLLTDYAKVAGHPKVNYQYFPSEQYVALLSTALRSGNPPSVLGLNGQDIRKYGLNGSLEPIKVDYLDRFRDLGPKTYTINGTLYGVPMGATGGFMILYNQQLLDKIGASYPQTYAELKTIGAELKKIGVAAFTHPGKTIYLWPVWFFTTYAQVTGNKPVEATQALLKGQGKWTDPEIVESLDLLFAFHRDGLFGEDIMGLDATGALANIERSKAAFWLGGDLAGLTADNPPKVTPGLQVLPKVVSASNVVSQFPGGPGNPLTINAKATDSEKEQAKALIDYLSTDAACTYLTQDGGGSFASNVKSTGSTDPAAVAAAKYIDQMFVYLDWYWPPEITTAFQKGIQAGLTGAKSASQVAGDVQTVWEQLLKSGYTFK